MVVIGADFSELELSRRSDADEILPFFNFSSHFTQLSGHSKQAVSLLDAPVINIAQSRGAFGEQGGRGDSHRGIRDMIHIHIDGIQFAARAGDIIIAPGNGCAHFFQHIGKPNVALHAIAANTGDFYRPAFNGSGGEEVGCRGGVAFNQIIARRAIVLIAAHDKSLIRLIFNLNAKGFHQVQRNINIRFGYQIAFNRNDGILRRQRGGHQERGQKLAGNAAVHFNLSTAETTAQAQRRVILLLQIINLRPALTQRVNQVTNRPLFHSRLAGQHNIVTPQT